MASAYQDYSDRDFKLEPEAEEHPLDSEDSTGEKRTSAAVSSPLYYSDSEDDGCCGDSGGFGRAEGLDFPETHRLLASSSVSRGAGGGVSSNTDGQDSASNSFPRMVDSPDTEWTDEKHSSYLDSIEASFVKKMYDKEYCALDLCGQAPKEQENLDPDSAESRLNFPSPFNEFKVWQKGRWRKPPQFDKGQQSAVPTVLGSPWVQHFRKLVSSNKQTVPFSSVNESGSSGAQKGAIMLKHPGNTSTALEKAPNVGQGTCAWHHRLQSNYTTFPSRCGKRELSAVYDKKFNVSATPVTDQNVDDETKVERSQGINILDANHNFEGNARGVRNQKNLKVNVDGGCSSPRDQVVPLLGSFNAEEAGDCNYTSKVQGFSADTNEQFNDSITSLPATLKNRTSFLKHNPL